MLLDIFHQSLMNAFSSVIRFWNVLESDNVIFQDLESFGIGRFFEVAMEKVLNFVWESFIIS